MKLGVRTSRSTLTHKNLFEIVKVLHYDQRDRWSKQYQSTKFHRREENLDLKSALHSEEPNREMPVRENKTMKERGRTMEELKPVLIVILILICGQGQRPGYRPEAIKAQRCWSASAAKAVISL